MKRSWFGTAFCSLGLAVSLIISCRCAWELFQTPGIINLVLYIVFGLAGVYGAVKSVGLIRAGGDIGLGSAPVARLPLAAAVVVCMYVAFTRGDPVWTVVAVIGGVMGVIYPVIPRHEY